MSLFVPVLAARRSSVPLSSYHMPQTPLCSCHQPGNLQDAHFFSSYDSATRPPLFYAFSLSASSTLSYVCPAPPTGRGHADALPLSRSGLERPF